MNRIRALVVNSLPLIADVLVGLLIILCALSGVKSEWFSQ